MVSSIERCQTKFLVVLFAVMASGQVAVAQQASPIQQRLLEAKGGQPMPPSLQFSTTPQPIQNPLPQKNVAGTTPAALPASSLSTLTNADRIDNLFDAANHVVQIKNLMKGATTAGDIATDEIVGKYIDVAAEKLATKYQWDPYQVKLALNTANNMATLNVKGELIDASNLMAQSFADTLDVAKNVLPPREKLPPEMRAQIDKDPGLAFAYALKEGHPVDAVKYGFENAGVVAVDGTKKAIAVGADLTKKLYSFASAAPPVPGGTLSSLPTGSSPSVSNNKSVSEPTGANPPINQTSNPVAQSVLKSSVGSINTASTPTSTLSSQGAIAPPNLTPIIVKPVTAPGNTPPATLVTSSGTQAQPPPYTFQPTSSGSIAVIKNGQIISTTTPAYASQAYGYNPTANIVAPAPAPTTAKVVTSGSPAAVTTTTNPVQSAVIAQPTATAKTSPTIGAPVAAATQNTTVNKAATTVTPTVTAPNPTSLESAAQILQNALAQFQAHPPAGISASDFATLQNQYRTAISNAQNQAPVPAVTTSATAVTTPAKPATTTVVKPATVVATPATASVVSTKPAAVVVATPAAPKPVTAVPAKTVTTVAIKPTAPIVVPAKPVSPATTVKLRGMDDESTPVPAESATADE